MVSWVVGSHEFRGSCARLTSRKAITLVDSPGSSQPSRPSLLIRIRDTRDGEAWEAFVNTYLPMIDRFARRVGLQDADVADVSQDVLSEVPRCIRAFEYQPDRGRFRDWLGVRFAVFFAGSAPSREDLRSDRPDGRPNDYFREWPGLPQDCADDVKGGLTSSIGIGPRLPVPGTGRIAS